DAGRAAVSDADLPVLSYDVVVIGSGAGGGIVAAELSKAGHSVLLLDKARYTHTTDLPKSEAQAYKLLYQNSAGLITEDGSMQMLAGKAWGGGTQINWSASLVPPQSLRKEWAEKYLSWTTTKAQLQMMGCRRILMTRWTRGSEKGAEGNCARGWSPRGSRGREAGVQCRRAGGVGLSPSQPIVNRIRRRTAGVARG
ncbi:hypothetical protein BC831DRAFT_542290, partial [Entophlyctis helioformis]